MSDGEKLMQIIRDAIVETARRPPGLRGPYVFDEAELQQTAKRVSGK